jgi:hypothetical protein
MKLKLENPFHCPEGSWPGICEAIDEPKKPVKGKNKNQVRLRFSVDTEEGEKMVARTFVAKLNVGGELHTFLNSWLGGDLDRLRGENGEFDLDLLIGEPALLQVVHGNHSAEYDYPVVLIAGIYPPRRKREE